MDGDLYYTSPGHYSRLATSSTCIVVSKHQVEPVPQYTYSLVALCCVTLYKYYNSGYCEISFNARLNCKKSPTLCLLHALRFIFYINILFYRRSVFPTFLYIYQPTYTILLENIVFSHVLKLLRVSVLELPAQRESIFPCVYPILVCYLVVGLDCILALTLFCFRC